MSTRKYFGTDGVRGEVGGPVINAEFALRLGYAAGKVLARGTRGGSRPKVLIGKDTRISGYMLESALEAGFSAAGIDVLLAGPLPTPAMAYLTRVLRQTAGIVISASAQSLSRQRHQILLQPGHEAARRYRGRHRGRAGRTAGLRALRGPGPRTAAWTTRPGATSNSARAPFRTTWT